MLSTWLLLGLCGLTSSYITCPDEKIKCNNQSTCCLTDQGYKCCPYPNAVCCADQAHCCPSGYFCNLVTQMCEKQDQPLLKMEPAEQVSQSDLDVSPLDNADKTLSMEKVSVVHCDNYYTCPDGTSCCRHPKGGWTCCRYSPGHCCLDGYHCCPYGYDCDYTYTHCVREGLMYPFSPRIPSAPEDKESLKKTPVTALTDKARVIRCDSHFYCQGGFTCCKDSVEQWSCCPYPLAQCCSDGKHCCEYGYSCDPFTQSCRRLPKGNRL